MSGHGSCLQLDIGNSGLKWRLVEGAAVVARGETGRADALPADWLPELPQSPGQIWVSSVAAPALEAQLTAQLQARFGVAPWFARSAGRTGDLVNSYAEPERMGVDRWLAMLAARRRCRGRCCVVDAGSALTIDLISAEGRHEGGYIIPGPVLMERALLAQTDRVRFDGAADFALHPGQSTAQAVRHGVALAQAGAVALVLARAANDPPALLLCGGGGTALLALLQSSGQEGRGLAGPGEVVPDLVFEGLAIMAQCR